MEKFRWSVIEQLNEAQKKLWETRNNCMKIIRLGQG